MPSFTFIITLIFLAYIGHSIWVIYGIFFPTSCQSKVKGRCISPYIAKNPNLEIQVYTSTKSTGVRESDLKYVWKNDSLNIDDLIVNVHNISIPLKTRRNGTLFLHVFVLPQGHDPFSSRYSYHMFAEITAYSLPKSEYISLIGESKKNNESHPPGKTFTHLRSKVTISVLGDNISFDRGAIPPDVFKYIRMSPEGDYLPIVFIDELNFRVRDLEPINKSSSIMPLTITYRPISVGKLRFWTNMLESIKVLHKFGFTDKDTDEVKGIFTDTNFYFLILTFAVAALHLLFDFLAFKNDISYWKNRKTMVGLSTRAVIWRCVSTIIIFFYLMDEETSLLVLIPAGIGTIIEVWKVKKAFKVSLSWTGRLPSIQLGTTSDKEKETEEFDAQAMKYLSYLLAPLCIGGAVYSLLYVPHKSWYSWCIQSLVNGVYAFGFLFMLPQLFVNYKFKSVAHLPWRAFMYKAFNTFIDDIFAFIITMPTAHRLACFRDDVVFVVYLYQRWLYPVDKSRVNEYGMTFDEEDKKKKD